MSTSTPVMNWNDCYNLVKVNGGVTGKHITYLIEGEPGCGKSSLGRKLADDLGFEFGYMDMANMSLGDMMMPVVDKDIRACSWYPNEIFHIHCGKPVVIMLDEWTKASKEVKNMSLPLALERRLGSIRLHPDSIVFATGNLSKDGVGDTIQGHQLNRFAPIEMRKPTSDEWISWALENGVAASVIVFVDQFKSVMASYRDGDSAKENPYIFNPSRQQKAYASPRSLEAASHAIHRKELVTGEQLFASLCGSVGLATAAEITAFVNMTEKLPTKKQIMSNPVGVKLPDSPAVLILLVFNLIMETEEGDLATLFKFVGRLPRELQALYVNKILSNQHKGKWASADRAMVAKCHELQVVFSA